MNRPYGRWALHYRDAGYLGVLPLPINRKAPPPDGFTGREGRWPSRAEVEQWQRKNPAGNIALRLPAGYVGVDVDQYDGKRGADELAKLETALGVKLPPAYRSSSRGLDNPSGIRVYRVPPGVELQSQPLPGVELIQLHHRYIVAPPSMHPQGRVYAYFAPDGELCPSDSPRPALEHAPWLPEAFVEHWRDDGRGGARKAELTDVQRDELLSSMSNGKPCKAVAERLSQALAACANSDGKSRHDAVVGGTGNHLLPLVSLGAQGHKGARGAIDELREAFVVAVSDRPEGTDAEHRSEYDRALSGALRIVAAEPTPQLPAGRDCCDPLGLHDRWVDLKAKPSSNGAVNVSLPVPPSPVDHPLWDARPALRRIHDHALSRRVSPWSVLGETLARLVAATGPRVQLPDIIGSFASLNLFIGHVAPSGGSGGGKSAGRAAARDVLATGAMFLDEYASLGVTEHTIGSGQGIAHAYRERVKGKLEWITDRAILSTDEVGHFAQKQQSGSTLMPELRRFFMGETLGHLYVDPRKRIEVPAHAYRGCLVVGIQPSQAGVLLEPAEAGAGTPQRFVWLPATYRHPDERPPRVAPLRWTKPRDIPKDGAERIVIDVCQTAWDAIDGAHLARSRGEGDALDGHLLLTREKVATAFGLLDERLSITDEDWQLAGEITDLSTAVRTWVIGVLDAEQQASRQARSAERVETEVAVAVAQERRRVIDASRRIAAKVWAEPDRWTRRGLYIDLRRWRDVLDDGLSHAVAEGWVVEDDESSHTDRSKRGLRRGERRPA